MLPFLYICIKDQDLVPNEPPPDLRGFPSEALDDVRIDDLPFGVDYGDIIVDANPSYLQGETVSVTFYSGNPRLSHQVRNFLPWNFYTLGIKHDIPT